MEEIPNECAEYFPFDMIEELRNEYLIGQSNFCGVMIPLYFDVLEPFIKEVSSKDSENNTCDLICIDEFIADLFDEEEQEVNIVN